MFTDRINAGYALAQELKSYKHEDGIVLAIPRGGLPVGYEVAVELDWPLSIVLTKKIGHPDNPEYAIGAVSLLDSVVLPRSGIPSAYIDNAIITLRTRLQEIYRQYTGSRKPVPVAGKTVIVTDDGIATGHTLLATVKMLRQQNPTRIIVAVPVASREAGIKLARAADEFKCLHIPDVFWSVGAFYEDFKQVSDRQVKQYLEKAEEHHHHH